MVMSKSICPPTPSDSGSGLYRQPTFVQWPFSLFHVFDLQLRVDPTDDVLVGAAGVQAVRAVAADSVYAVPLAGAGPGGGRADRAVPGHRRLPLHPR